MKSFAPLAALLFATSALAQSTLTINTPINPPVCQPLLLTWTGGTPPYFLRLLPGNDPTGNTILDFGQQSGTSLTWVVNVTAGTSLGLTLTDSTGLTAQSAAFTVQTSTNQGCLNAQQSTTGGSATGSTTAAGTTKPVSTPAGTTVAPVTSATAPAVSSSKASSAATSASASSSAHASSAATAQKVSFGIAGAIGAAAIALFA